MLPFAGPLPERPRDGRGRRRQAAGRRRQQQPAARAEIFHRHIAQERDGGENDGDDPDFPRVDAAERSDRLVGHEREPDERHREQHQPGAQLRPGDLFHPSVQLLAQRQQRCGGDRSGSGDPHVADDRIGGEREGQHAGDRGRGRVTAACPALLQREQREHGRVTCKSDGDDDAAARARSAAQRHGERAGRAAEQPGDGEGADAGGAPSGLDVARPPATLEPDQEPNAERDGKS
jgi:hypothetical protein